MRDEVPTAQAADTIASFLYRIHRDALAQSHGERVYYEDHTGSKDAFDRDNEPIRLGDVELLPSRLLFHGDGEANEAALNDFLAEQNAALSGAAVAAPGAGAWEAE